MSTGWTQFRNDLKFLTLRVIVWLENDSILSNFEHKKINERFDVFFFSYYCLCKLSKSLIYNYRALFFDSFVV